MKKLLLKQQQIEENKYQYRVIQVVNAVDPKVGAVFKEHVASKYCNNRLWNVTIKAE